MAAITSLYGELSSHIFDKLNLIKLLVCDVDGVFSDGRIYLGNAREELKTFHTKDGYGVKALLNCHVASGFGCLVEKRHHAADGVDFVEGKKLVHAVVAF